jgi:hypothetical protein
LFDESSLIPSINPISLFVSFATIEGGEGGYSLIKERAGIDKTDIMRV